MNPLPTKGAIPLLLRASTTHPLRTVLFRLGQSLKASGAFLRNPHIRSSQAASLSLELFRNTTGETYVSLVASGLDLHRDAHMALASLCTPEPMPIRPGSSSLIEIQLDIRSLDAGARFTPTLAISA